MEGTLWRTVAVQPAVLVGWQPGASAPGFLFPATSKKTCVRRSFLRAQGRRQRAGITTSAQVAAAAQENIGFCFIVLYSDLLNGS